jgi:hypothetical protein
MRVVVLAIFLFAILLTGCQAAREAGQEVGKPIGGTMKAVGGVTEGAVEGYVDEGKDNPYNR